MKYRAALIGCGNIGSLYAEDPLIKGIYTHAEAYVVCENVELVALCDVNKENLLKCAERWNVSSVYSNVEKLLAEQHPEIVSLCTPDKTHADLLDIILKTPGVRAVLAEKPLALDSGSAERLVHLAKKQDVILAVNYSRRYSTGHIQLKKIIQSGEIGSIQSVSGFYTKGLFHNGTHWLDLARWLIGEIKSVQGFNINNANPTDPTLNAWLKFENGAEGFLYGLDAEAFSLFEMDIMGTKGRIRLIDSGHRVEFFEVAKSSYYSGYKTIQKTHEQEGELGNTLLHAVNDLVTCLELKLQPQCSGADALVALNIATAIVKSAQSGKPFTLKENMKEDVA